MKVIGVTLFQLQALAAQSDCRIAQRSSYGHAPKERTRRDGRAEVTFTLRALYANGKARPHRRVSAFPTRAGKERTIGGVLCWHGHRDFMARLFEAYPAAILSSCFARYEGRDGFLQDYPATGEQNIGSMYYPLKLQDACYCGRTGHDERGLPVEGGR